MIPFRVRVEHFIIVVLAVLLMLESCGKETTSASISETSIDEKIITKVDSSRNSGIKNLIPEEIRIIEHPDRIEKVDPLKISTPDQGKTKPAYRYQDTVYFPGSRVISEIISEGRILEHNLDLKIDHLQRIITTKKTTVKEISGFFFSPALSYSPSAGIETIEANITYINRGDFGLSAGAYYNTLTHHTGLKLTIHKKIW